MGEVNVKKIGSRFFAVAKKTNVELNWKKKYVGVMNWVSLSAVYAVCKTVAVFSVKHARTSVNLSNAMLK